VGVLSPSLRTIFNLESEVAWLRAGHRPPLKLYVQFPAYSFAFVQRLWQLQPAYSWSPNLVLTSFIQYETDSQTLGSNTRLRWTVKPGNDVSSFGIGRGRNSC
jgi:hypothetical protein